MSGDSRSQSVVRSRGVVAGTGDAGGADDEVGVGVHVAAVDVDHAGLSDERFAVSSVNSTRYLPGFTLNVKPPALLVARALPLARLDVDDLDRSAVDRARAFGPADRAADRAVGLDGFGGVSMTGTPLRQAARLSSAAKRAEQPTGGNAVRAVATNCRHSILARAKLQARGHCAHPRSDDAFARQWRRRRGVVEDDRAAIAFGRTHRCLRAAASTTMHQPPIQSHPREFRRSRVLKVSSSAAQDRNTDANEFADDDRDTLFSAGLHASRGGRPDVGTT